MKHVIDGLFVAHTVAGLAAALGGWDWAMVLFTSTTTVVVLVLALFAGVVPFFVEDEDLLRRLKNSRSTPLARRSLAFCALASAWCFAVLGWTLPLTVYLCLMFWLLMLGAQIKKAVAELPEESS